MRIRPTFTCFDDAIDFVVEAKIDSSKWHEYTIVHGICLAPQPSNVRYVHAWIEHHGKAIQVMLDEDAGGERFAVALEAAEFRDHWRVQHETRYTVHEAALENLRTGHKGPWVAKYIRMQERRTDLRRRTWVGPTLERLGSRDANDDSGGDDR